MSSYWFRMIKVLKNCEMKYVFWWFILVSVVFLKNCLDNFIVIKIGLKIVESWFWWIVFWRLEFILFCFGYLFVELVLLVFFIGFWWIFSIYIVCDDSIVFFKFERMVF